MRRKAKHPLMTTVLWIIAGTAQTISEACDNLADCIEFEPKERASKPPPKAMEDVPGWVRKL